MKLSKPTKLKASIILYLLSMSLLSFGQTQELNFSGTGDKDMELGHYRLGNSIHIEFYAGGGWAEDGGVYHITGDWGELPRVTFINESDIQNRLTFHAQMDGSGACYLFAKWINNSPGKSSTNSLKFIITSGGYFDVNNTNGDIGSASELESVFVINSNSKNVGVGTRTPSSLLTLKGVSDNATLKILAHNNPNF